MYLTSLTPTFYPHCILALPGNKRAPSARAVKSSEHLAGEIDTHSFSVGTLVSFSTA